MPSKDDDDPASTKDVVTKRQKQLLNREEMDLNLIAESLGGFLIEKPLSSLTTPNPEALEKKIKGSVPKIETKPRSPRDFPGYDPAAEADALADIEKDMRSGNVDPKTQSPRPQRPLGPSDGMGSRVMRALRDFGRSARTKIKGFRLPKSGRGTGGASGLLALPTLLNLPDMVRDLDAFLPGYDPKKDPRNVAYVKPDPKEVEKLKPTPTPTPAADPEPTPKPKPETQPEPETDKTSDKKRKKNKVNAPVGIKGPGASGSGQGQARQITTPLVLPLAQPTRTTPRGTTGVRNPAGKKGGRGKFKISPPGYGGKIGRRANPQ